MSNWDVMKWEGGEPKRPLTRAEFREQLEITLAQWVDAHRGHDSGFGDTETLISDIGEEVETSMDDLFEESSVIANPL